MDLSVTVVIWEKRHKSDLKKENSKNVSYDKWIETLHFPNIKHTMRKLRRNIFIMTVVILSHSFKIIKGGDQSVEEIRDMYCFKLWHSLHGLSSEIFKQKRDFSS